MEGDIAHQPLWVAEN